MDAVPTTQPLVPTRQALTAKPTAADQFMGAAWTPLPRVPTLQEAIAQPSSAELFSGAAAMELLEKPTSPGLTARSTATAQTVF
jgi:hypothetical protein